jgi:hypothetical protein
MNYATALTLSDWATEAQVYSQQVIRFTPIVLKALSKTIAPVTIASIKGFSNHWFESECYWRQRITNLAGITYNPLTASIRVAHAELTSTEAQATYRRVRHIATESAMDMLVIGLCGVVAIASGVEAVQKIYGFAKRVYRWVDDLINPPLEQPTLLPTVDLCLAHLSDAELAARIESLVDPLLLEVVDEAIAPSSESTPLQSTEDEPIAFWNPQPKDMHTEVQQRLQATAAPAVAEDCSANALNVPGATGDKPGAKASNSKAKGGTHNARANVKLSKGDAAAVATRRGRKEKG